MRVSYIDSGIGPTLPLSTIAELDRKKAARVSFHSNRIKSLDIIISSATHHRNDKEEDAIRNGSSLNYLSELDISSNNLHEGYPLPSISSKKKVLPLLGMCTTLCKLNLSSNNLNEKLFGNLLIDGDNNVICLTQLHTLDISRNNFTKLPTQLHEICPSLKHLLAQHNKIKSLITLLQTLHNLRGQMESVTLMNNPIYSKEFYYEKIIFVLKLSKLDNRKICENDIEKARIKLERAISTRSDTTTTHREPVISRRNNNLRQHQNNQVNCEEYRELCHEEENGVIIDNLHPHQQFDQNNSEEINALKEQIAALSALVETQVSNNNANNNASLNEKENIPPPAEAAAVAAKEEQTLEKILQYRHRAAATLIQLSLLSQRHEQSSLYFAISLWALSTKLRRMQTSNVTYIEAEKGWQATTAKLVNKNKILSENIEKGKIQLERSRAANKASKKEVLHLTQQVKELTESLQNDRMELKNSQGKSNKNLEEAKYEVQQLKVALQKEKEEREKQARNAETELNKLRKELQLTSQQLHDERREKAKLESVNNQMATANQEASELATANSQQLHQLRLEIIQKDTTIQRLKDSYQQAARISATDRSQYEKVSSSEQQAKDLLRKQSSKLQSVKAEMERLIDKHKSSQSKLYSEINTSTAKVSGLLSEMEEKDRIINNSERRIKSIMNERDEMQKQLTECNRIRSRAEQRNNHLQAQLDQADDDIRQAKRCSVDRNQLEIEMSRARELKHSLNVLRQTSEQRELEFQTKNKAMHRDNILLREDAKNHEKTIKSLREKLQVAKSERKSREMQIFDSHRAEMQEKEQANISMNRNFEAERKFTLYFK